jgi:hypothetical protein
VYSLPIVPDQGTLSWGLFIPGNADLIHTDPTTWQTSMVRELDFNPVDVTIYLSLNPSVTVGQTLPFKLKRVAFLAGDGTMHEYTNIQKQTLRAVVP